MLAEGLAEAALRLVARVERGRGEVFALAQALQAAAQPSRAAVGIEGHTEGPLEIAAGALGADAERAQLGRAQAPLGLRVDRGEQPRDPFRGLAVRLERPAALARPVAREQGVLDRGEELDVLAQRLAGRAGRTAEDPGRAHAGHEDAVVGGVLPVEGPLHLLRPQRGRGAHVTGE